MSLIEDRENDFTQELFIAPISRYAIVFGKILGEALVAQQFAQLLSPRSERSQVSVRGVRGFTADQRVRRCSPRSAGALPQVRLVVVASPLALRAIHRAARVAGWAGSVPAQCEIRR